jgi:opacity protein-like surface antigen
VNIIRLIKLTLLLSCFGFAPTSLALSSLIEFSKRSSSDTLRDVSALGFYSFYTPQHDYALYAGIELAQFEPISPDESDTTTRVKMGISGISTFAPYAEVGTSLFDFLFNASNKDTDPCTEEKNCNPDYLYRVGLRINLESRLSLGLFYEGISFGDFQEKLTGTHNYTGATLGVRF